jgi:uncharacterized repeat protein (TIGR01451 family)
LGRIAGLLEPRSKRSAPKRRFAGHVLGLERLESRTLMSVNVLPSIAGVCYRGPTGSSLTAGDVPLASVTVNLFLDGGDGKFEGKAAGSDDTLVGTTTTNANGNYHFNNLSPGTYFVQQVPVPGVALAGQGVATVTIAASDTAGQPGTVIDPFDSTPQMVSDSQFFGRTVSSATGLNVPIVGGTGVGSTLAVPDALGGYRSLFIERTSTHGAISMDADANLPGALEFDSNAASSGIYWVTWDGQNANAQTLNPTGLGQVDLTSQGASTGLELNLGADHDGGFALVKIYSDASDWSWASVPIPNSTDGSLGQSVFVPWTSFDVGGGSGASFNSVGAVQLDINGVSAIDGQVGEVLALGPKVFTENFANVAEADLAIVKTAAPSPVDAGGQLTYTFTATNNGPSTATDATISDPLPAGLSFVSATTSQGTVNFASGTVTVGLGSLADGAGATVTVTTSVDPSLTGSLTNTATISGDQTDPNLSNNTSTVTTPVSAVADLAITKTGAPNPVTAGKQLTYTLTSTNNGPSNATGVTVVDTLPAGVSYVSGTSSQGSVSDAGGTVTIALGNLASGASASTTIVVGVASTTTGPLTNTAVISGNQTDPNTANNTASCTTQVDQPVTPKSEIDLAIVKGAAPNPVSVGANLTYTLTVSNNSTTTATAVSVSDTLPYGVTFVSATASQGSVTDNNGTLQASLGDMAGDSDGTVTATVTIVVNVASSAGATITNTATVTGTNDQPDADPTNNTSTVVTQVTRAPFSKSMFVHH